MTGDEDLESFRAEVRAFLDAELPAEKRFAADGFANASKELTAWWQGVRAKRGWGAPGWPKQYGGCEWSLAKKRIFADESTKAGAPSYSPFGITMVAPSSTPSAPKNRRQSIFRTSWTAAASGARAIRSRAQGPILQA